MVRIAFRAEPLVLSGHGLGASEQLEGSTTCEGCRKEGLLSAMWVCVTLVLRDLVELFFFPGGLVLALATTVEAAAGVLNNINAAHMCCAHPLDPTPLGNGVASRRGDWCCAPEYSLTGRRHYA